MVSSSGYGPPVRYGNAAGCQKDGQDEPLGPWRANLPRRPNPSGCGRQSEILPCASLPLPLHKSVLIRCEPLALVMDQCSKLRHIIGMELYHLYVEDWEYHLPIRAGFKLKGSREYVYAAPWMYK